MSKGIQYDIYRVTVTERFFKWHEDFRDENDPWVAVTSILLGISESADTPLQIIDDQHEATVNGFYVFNVLASDKEKNRIGMREGVLKIEKLEMNSEPEAPHAGM